MIIYIYIIYIYVYISQARSHGDGRAPLIMPVPQWIFLNIYLRYLLPFM